MKQVQQDFLDAITFRYDDETRRTMLKIFAHKETLLDADLLEEHLVNQPLLGCIILLLLFLSLTSLIFAIVFVSCRALGNCGAKRYQPHPTSGRSYAVLCFVFLISWLVMAISASFFIQAGAAFWNPKVPKEFDEDHMIIRRNASGQFLEAHRVEKRAATTMKPMAKMSIFDLFGDADYQGDFEQTETSSTTVSSFVTASIAPEDRPIPISRTNKKRVSTTNVVVKRPIVESVDVSIGKSTESDDVPPAVDKLPIRKIELETTLRPLKKFEIPARPMAELEFARHFDHAVSRPIIQAPFVSDTWSKAAFSSQLQQKKKLSIQPLSPPVAILGENTLESENSEEEEVEDEEHSLSTPLLELMTSSTPQSIRNDVTEPSTTASSTTVTASPVTTTSSTTSTTISPLLMNDVNDDVINNKNDVMDESQDAIESTETVPSSSKSIEVTTATVEEVDDDVMLSSSSDVIFKESDVMHANDDADLSTIEPVFDANVRESMESVGASGNVDDVMTTDLSSSPIPVTSTVAAATENATDVSITTAEHQSFMEMQKETTEEEDVDKRTSSRLETVGTEEVERQSHSEDQEDFVLTAETSSRAPDTEIPSSTAASMTSSATEMTTTDVKSSVVPVTEEKEAEEETKTTPSRIVQFTIDEEEMTSPAMEMTSQETTTTEETTTVRITTSEEDEVTFLTTTEEPIGIEEIEEKDKEEVLHFVPIPTEPKPEEWQPITETPRTETSVGVFPSVPLKPDVSHGKVEQLATPLLYPYRLLHTTGILWLSRISLFILGGVMVIVLLPSLILVLLGTIYYKSTQHPIDRRKTSDQIGQLVVILSTFLLFTLPLMFIFVQIMLTYNHLHNAICPTLQLKYQQDLGILGQINTLTPESREIFLRNTINKDNCQASQASIETMWLSCLFFCLSSIPLLISLFKLSKYYLRMKTEYYWKLNDYGTIYAKRPAMDSAQSIYGNIYGTVGPRRPTSRPPPVPESPSYADGPLYSDGPIYGVYQAYGRF